MNNSRKSRKSQVINPEDILKFVGECASKLLLLKGIITPPETIRAIAEELLKLNPLILENKNTILLSIALGDFQFRTPKQMTIDDFLITPEKIQNLKNLGKKIFTEEEVSRIKKEVTNSKILSLEDEIERLKEEIRKLEYEWMKYPEEMTKKGYKEFKNLLNEVMEKNILLSDKNEKLKMIISRLEKQLEFNRTTHNSYIIKGQNDKIIKHEEVVDS